MAGLKFSMTEDRSEFGEEPITVTGSGRASVGGVDVLKEFRLTAQGWAAAGVELQMQCSVINGLPKCTAVLFHVPDQDKEVPAWIIRDFRLEDMVEGAFARASTIWGQDPEAWAEMRERDHAISRPAGQALVNKAIKATRAARKQGRTHYTEELLRGVATAYNANIERFPTKSVRIEYGVSQTTAQTYVRKAREAGFITKTAQRTGRPKRERRTADE